MRTILAMFISCVLCYLLIGFFCWTLDPAEIGWFGRFIWLVFTMILSGPIEDELKKY